MKLYVSVGAARVRKLFEQAKNSTPTIIFIDELDSSGLATGVTQQSPE